jgi:DNA primase
MQTRDKKSSSYLYTKEQVSRVIAGAGITVEGKMGAEHIIFCPFHGNSRTPAGEINEESGTFFCFSCQKVADLVELVMHMTSRSYFEAVRFINSKSTGTNIENIVNQKLIEQPEFVEYDKSLINKLHQSVMNSDRGKQYLFNRKITLESIQKFELGFSENQDMVTIPMHAPDGMLVGFVARSVEGKDFKNTPGMPKSKILFNLHRVKSSRKVYVVESSFDVIRLDQCGLPAVATLGANVSNPQIELLQKYFNDIFVIADNDEAGDGMAKRLQEKIGNVVTRLQLNKEYKDIGDMSDDQIKNLETSFDKTILSMLN